MTPLNMAKEYKKERTKVNNAIKRNDRDLQRLYRAKVKEIAAVKQRFDRLEGGLLKQRKALTARRAVLEGRLS